MFPDKDQRPFTANTGNLNGRANLIASNVKTVPKRVSPNVEYIMKSLKSPSLTMV